VRGVEGVEREDWVVIIFFLSNQWLKKVCTDEMI